MDARDTIHHSNPFSTMSFWQMWAEKTKVGSYTLLAPEIHEES